MWCIWPIVLLAMDVFGYLALPWVWMIIDLHNIILDDLINHYCVGGLEG